MADNTESDNTKSPFGIDISGKALGAGGRFGINANGDFALGVGGIFNVEVTGKITFDFSSLSNFVDNFVTINTFSRSVSLSSKAKLTLNGREYLDMNILELETEETVYYDGRKTRDIHNKTTVFGETIAEYKKEYTPMTVKERKEADLNWQRLEKTGELGDAGDGPEGKVYDINRDKQYNLNALSAAHDAVRDPRDNPFNSLNPSSALSQDSQYGEEGGFGYSEYDRAHNSANGFEGGNNGGGASNKENFCDGWANDDDFEEMDIIKQVSSNRLIYVNYVSYGCFLKH